MGKFITGVIVGIAIYILSPIHAIGIKADIYCDGEFLLCEWYFDNNEWFVVGFGTNNIWDK